MAENISFESYYDKYISLGLKPVRCYGYSKQNKENDKDEKYKKAKIPLDSKFTDKDYRLPSKDKCKEHFEENGWIGWVLPDNLLALDIESEKDSDFVIDVLKSKGIKPIIHETNNGIHLLFRNTNQISGSSKTEISLGLSLTFRNGGKNYLILAPSNDRKWSSDLLQIELDDIPELPEVLYPMKNCNTDVLLESIAYRVGQAYSTGELDGFEDIDTSFVGWLVLDQGVSEDQVHCLLKIIYKEEYNYERTKLMFGRLGEDKNLKKGGSFVRSLKEKGCREIISLVEKVSLIEKYEIKEVSFPKEILPKNLEILAESLAESYSVHHEYVVMLMITILSSFIGNSAKVKTKRGDSRSVFFWFMVVAPSGYGKSPVINELLSVVDELQKEAYEEYKVERTRYEQLDRDEKRRAKIPKMFHYVAKDFTFEALVDIFEFNQRGVLIYKDEIAGLFKGLNQYRQGKGNDEESLLQLFDSKPIKVDRVGSGTKYCHITGASILGGIQPIAMRGIFNGAKCFDGTLPRFLPMPLEKKRVKYNQATISKELIDFWKSCIRDLNGQLKPLSSDPISFELSDEADTEFGTFVEVMSNEVNSGHGASELVGVFIPKLITYCIQFAGFFCLMDQLGDFKYDEFGRKYTVEITHLRKAVQMTEYFLYKCTQLERYLAYTIEKTDNASYAIYLAKALKENRELVENGRIRLKHIKDSMNNILPDRLRIKDKSASLENLLHDFGLECEVGRAREKYLKWDKEVVDELIKKYC